MNGDRRDALPEQIMDEASAWIARLRSDAAGEEDRQQFALWLAGDPRRQRAMDTQLEMWDDLAVVRALPLEARPVTHRRRFIVGGLALAASLVLAVLLVPGSQLPGAPGVYETRVGEQLHVELEDGSQVTLNTATRLEVDLQASERHLTLLRGEAFFQVKPDPERPFSVSAGDARVTALGTAFNIYLDGGTSRVTVTEGVVRVTELHAPTTRPADTEILRENQGIEGDRTGLATSFTADTARTLAWRDGKLVADGMTLLALAAELSRYHPRKIIVAEPDLAQQTVSGVFELRDPETILKALEHSFAVRSVVLDDGSIQLIRAPL